uniref:Uncharacterized protein n=1 Tax=Utricularia reniformis TaxID=192314 RepID=A0A1Y0B0G0_9LAMI|nr:hypothetical protein AEK19_MT0672 [Utricularia reniformis]ART30922.1 hypothetical protein AEK19_MT0672 [Utricularia reniformis]
MIVELGTPNRRIHLSIRNTKKSTTWTSFSSFSSEQAFSFAIKDQVLDTGSEV